MGEHDYDLGSPRGRRQAILRAMEGGEMSLVEICRALSVEEARDRASMRSALNSLDRNGQIVVATREDGRPVSRERSIVFRRNYPTAGMARSAPERVATAPTMAPTVVRPVVPAVASAAPPAAAQAVAASRPNGGRRVRAATDGNLFDILKGTSILKGDGDAQALRDAVFDREGVLRGWTLADYAKDRAGFKSQVATGSPVAPEVLRRLVFLLDGCVGGRVDVDSSTVVVPGYEGGALPALKDSVLAMPLSELLDDGARRQRLFRSLREGPLADRTARDFVDDPRSVYDALLSVDSCGLKTAAHAMETMRAKLKAIATKRAPRKAARA